MDYSSLALKPIALGLFLVQSSTIIFVLLLSVRRPFFPLAHPSTPASFSLSLALKCTLSSHRSLWSSSTGASAMSGLSRAWLADELVFGLHLFSHSPASCALASSLWLQLFFFVHNVFGAITVAYSALHTSM